MATITTKPELPDQLADLAIRGQTTEAMLRKLEAGPTKPEEYRAIIAALVRRYDRKAERRAERAADGIAVGQPA